MQPLREGWLGKRGEGRFDGWQQRRFELWPARLDYFDESGALKGSLGLLGRSRLELGKAGRFELHGVRASNRGLFERIVRLEAHDSADRDGWAEAIRGAIGQLRAGMSLRMSKVAAEISSKLDTALAQRDHALVADLENRLEAVKDYQRQIAAAVREQDYGRAAELKKKLTLAAEGRAGPSSPIKPQKALQVDLDRVSQEMSLASVRSGVKARRSAHPTAGRGETAVAALRRWAQAPNYDEYPAHEADAVSDATKYSSLCSTVSTEHFEEGETLQAALSGYHDEEVEILPSASWTDAYYQ